MPSKEYTYHLSMIYAHKIKEVAMAPRLHLGSLVDYMKHRVEPAGCPTVSREFRRHVNRMRAAFADTSQYGAPQSQTEPSKDDCDTLSAFFPTPTEEDIERFIKRHGGV